MQMIFPPHNFCHVIFKSHGFEWYSLVLVIESNIFYGKIYQMIVFVCLNQALHI